MKKILAFVMAMIVSCCCVSLSACGEESKVIVIDNGGTENTGGGTDKDKENVFDRESAIKQLKYTPFKKGTPVSFGRYDFHGLGQDRFYISGYIGPQTSYPAEGYLLPSLITEETFQKLEDCGINYITEIKLDYTTNRENVIKALELAEKHDIYYLTLVSEAVDFHSTVDLNFVGEQSAMKSAMQELMQYKAFGGFYGRDEPTSDMYDDIALANKRFQSAKKEIGESAGTETSGITVYYNMFPRVSGKQLSNDTENGLTYDEYLDRFIDIGTGYLSFDSYPIAGMENKVAPSWFNELNYIAHKAKTNNIPWLGYAQAGGGSAFINCRITNEYELCWDVNTMLAFGCKGISYYPLVYPPELIRLSTEEQSNDHSLLNKYGNKTPMYYYAQKINKQINAMSYLLCNAAHENVIINGDDGLCVLSDNYNTKVSSYRGLKSVTGDASLVGCFDYNGSMAFLVVNNSLTNHRGEITLNFDENYGHIVTQRGIQAAIATKNLTLTLEAGECALVEVL